MICKLHLKIPRNGAVRGTPRAPLRASVHPPAGRQETPSEQEGSFLQTRSSCDQSRLRHLLSEHRAAWGPGERFSSTGGLLTFTHHKRLLKQPHWTCFLSLSGRPRGSSSNPLVLWTQETSFTESEPGPSRAHSEHLFRISFFFSPPRNRGLNSELFTKRSDWAKC